MDRLETKQFILSKVNARKLRDLLNNVTEMEVIQTPDTVVTLTEYYERVIAVVATRNRRRVTYSYSHDELFVPSPTFLRNRCSI